MFEEINNVTRQAQAIALQAQQDTADLIEPTFYIDGLLARFGLLMFSSLGLVVITCTMLFPENLSVIWYIYHIGYIILTTGLILLNLGNRNRDDQLLPALTLVEMVLFFPIQISPESTLVVITCCLVVGIIVVISIAQTFRYCLARGLGTEFSSVW